MKKFLLTVGLALGYCGLAAGTVDQAGLFAKLGLGEAQAVFNNAYSTSDGVENTTGTVSAPSLFNMALGYGWQHGHYYIAPYLFYSGLNLNIKQSDRYGASSVDRAEFDLKYAYGVNVMLGYLGNHSELMPYVTLGYEGLKLKQYDSSSDSTTAFAFAGTGMKYGPDFGLGLRYLAADHLFVDLSSVATFTKNQEVSGTSAGLTSTTRFSPLLVTTLSLGYRL